MLPFALYSVRVPFGPGKFLLTEIAGEVLEDRSRTALEMGAEEEEEDSAEGNGTKSDGQGPAD